MSFVHTTNVTDYRVEIYKETLRLPLCTQSGKRVDATGDVGAM